MNKIDNLDKELAEYIGFKWIPQTEGEPWSEHWIDPDGIVYGKLCPNFTGSIDTCFKWLALKLERIEVMWDFTSKQIYASIQTHHPYMEYYAFDDDNLAFALCLAVKKLIDEEKK